MRLEDFYIAKYNRLNREKMSAINSNHIFADDTARDTYFTTNPTEKIPSLIISVGVGYQEWNGSDWIDKTGLVGAGDAVYISVQDAGSYFTGTDTEAILQEIGEDISVISSELSDKIKTSTFTASADNTTNIIHNLIYDSVHDDLLVIYNGILLEKTLNYIDNVNSISIDLVDWSINTGDKIFFKLYKNVK